jgi:SAM-dependent methyltransferase
MEKYFYEAFEDMKRFGPGSDESTTRAAKMFPVKKNSLKILDIGCGIGTHTFVIARKFPNADIIAIDTYAPHIEKLNFIAAECELADRVHGIVMSMFEMTFENESFDLIWSEGSAYIAGFSNAIKDWKRLLKSGGYIICSEISWLRDNPSEESKEFWNEAYSEMNTIGRKTEQIREQGYEFEGCFTCPVSDWTVNYYDKIAKNLEKLEKRYPGNAQAMEAVQHLQEEINLYKEHNNDYSYIFYAMKKK